MKIIKAARGRVTGHFGATNVPGSNVPSHLGTDIGHGDQTEEDLRVNAPAAGKVIAVGKQGTYGLRVLIDHGNRYESLLAHLSAVHVAVGENVAEGQHIARMGNSGGNWPVHLHQELRLNGVFLNPEKYFYNPTAESEDDMFSEEDRALLARIEKRLDALEGAERDADKDRENIGAHITREVDRIAGVLNKIITREGKGARAYVATDNGECIVVSTLGKWWLPIATEGAEGTVNILEDRGWCQPWADRKKLDRPAFDQAMRFYDRLNTGAFHLEVTL
ncbi:hypothetical protein ASF48_06955 [Rathayibacter sp. Leaf299]|uniref:M23 family metallopeptidase n=1 Tax=Rathayibacter sp. Leaf299 TaxID=1736328 RepID=UPI0006F44FFE|nr:M23 family metallopeptidase [Rathayibacter sp. Leaf299]KQQ22869.1 hypothetical protein ASF48_06955 [Rathayibacter sp. Leaf299]